MSSLLVHLATGMQKAFMAAAGLKYDTCTPEELKEHILLYDKDLWQLLTQVEVSKWNHELVEELRKAPYSGVFYKVCACCFVTLQFSGYPVPTCVPPPLRPPVPFVFLSN